MFTREIRIQFILKIHKTLNTLVSVSALTLSKAELNDRWTTWKQRLQMAYILFKLTIDPTSTSSIFPSLKNDNTGDLNNFIHLGPKVCEQTATPLRTEVKQYWLLFEDEWVTKKTNFNRHTMKTFSFSFCKHNVHTWNSSKGYSQGPLNIEYTGFSFSIDVKQSRPPLKRER